MSHGDWASEPGVDRGTHGSLLDGGAELSPPLTRRRIMDRVSQLVADCGEDHWDSYGAKGITVAAADAFSDLLARSTFPGVDGGFSFEMDLPNDGTVSFLVRPDGSVNDLYVKTPDGREIEWEGATSERVVSDANTDPAPDLIGPE